MGAWVYINSWEKPLIKGLDGDFKEKLVYTDEWFTVMPCFDDDEDGDEINCATVVDAWRMWKQEKDGDAAVGQGRYWKYRFYFHRIREIDGQLVDEVTPIKIYRRGNKIFSKAITE